MDGAQQRPLVSECPGFRDDRNTDLAEGEAEGDPRFDLIDEAQTVDAAMSKDGG